MPPQVNFATSANYQKFVDFAEKAYADHEEDSALRFAGAPKGDYKGSFASFRRTSGMKAANDQVRDLFRKTVANMFGGEKFSGVGRFNGTWVFNKFTTEQWISVQ